ncbi:hypothetical protein ACLOJK_004072, partial [Asimina triloba]
MPTNNYQWLNERAFTRSADVSEMYALDMLDANFDVLNRKLDEMNMNVEDAPIVNELVNQSEEAVKEELKTYTSPSFILSEEEAPQ